MEVVLYFVVAIVSGLIVHIGHRSKKTSGTLRIDHSNPEKDIYLFEIDDAVLDSITKKKRIILDIDHNAVLSQNQHGLL